MGAPSFSEIQAAGAKFGLTDEELQQGLNAFSKWHQNRFGSGFTNESSASAIVNGAIQNALNFRTDAGWGNWDVKHYEGAGALNNALNYSATPERIRAHTIDGVTALLNAELSYAGEEGGIAGPRSIFGGNLGAGFGGRGVWTSDDIAKIAAMTADAGKSETDLINQIKGIKSANPNDTVWWGPSGYMSALASNWGLDASKYIDPAKAQQEAATTAAVGNNFQASQGHDWTDDALKIGGMATALWGFGAAISGALGAGAAAGATAEAGATAAAAGDAGFLTAGGVTTPQTGGMFVGNSSMLGGTGNAIADAALNGAVRGGITSTLTGGDPVSGLISGGVSGGVSSLLPDLGSTALNNAAKGAVSGGVGAAVNGGDVLTGAAAGGAAGGVGTLVRDAVGTELGGNTLANAAAGGAAGAVGSAIAGGDVATGLIRGAVTGGASGAATDLGADPAIAGAAGTLAGSLINSPTPDAGTPPAQQQQTANEITSGLGFSVVLPQFQNNPRRDMQWGTRLNGG